MLIHSLFPIFVESGYSFTDQFAQMFFLVFIQVGRIDRFAKLYPDLSFVDPWETVFKNIFCAVKTYRDDRAVSLGGDLHTAFLKLQQSVGGVAGAFRCDIDRIPLFDKGNGI